MFCCLKSCMNSDINRLIPTANVSNIHLDNTYLGHEVIIVKDGYRICGTGGALASAPLVQSKSYFEIKLQQNGKWSIGLATRKVDLNKTQGGTDAESWCLTSDHMVQHNSKEIYKLLIQTSADVKNTALPTINESFQASIIDSMIGEGDIIGVAYDHIELNFYLNGKNLNVPVLNIKGTVYPALFVDEGAILDIVVDDFTYGPPPGFDKIMIEQSLL